TVIIGIFVGVISLSIILGIITTISALLVLNLYLGMRINRTEASINGQVPALLAGIKANIQANQTPERAFINVIDDIGDPIYSELAPTQQQIRSGVELHIALQELKERTSSRELAFLCSCIILASSYGANLESQIGIIQEQISNR